MYRTKYEAATLRPMKTFLSIPAMTGTRSEHVTVEALATSGSLVSILSYDLAGRINMEVKKPGYQWEEDSGDAGGARVPA